MKKIYLIAAAVSMALVFGACSGKSGQGAGAGETSVTAESESGKEAETSVEAKEETSKAAGEEKTGGEETSSEETTEEAVELAVTGRVESVNKSVITVSGNDGLTYQVDLSDAETRSSLELGEGDEIQVIFLDSKEEVKKAQSYDIISSFVLEGDFDPVIAGVIREASGDTLTIETAGGKTCSFSIGIAQVVTGEKGLASGENVEVTYLGQLGDGTALRVITEDGSGDIEATYNALVGTLTAASDQAAVIVTADGRQFTFAAGENVFPTDYEIGEEVEISYEGSLSKNNAVAVCIDSM